MPIHHSRTSVFSADHPSFSGFIRLSVADQKIVGIFLNYLVTTINSSECKGPKELNTSDIRGDIYEN